MPRIGAHVSAGGGLHNAPQEAARMRLDSFQFFTRPPQSGRAADLTDREIDLFLAACREVGLKSWHVHAPYIINLASAEERIRRNSVRLLREELERADALKSRSVIAHVGSAAGSSREDGLTAVIAGLKEVLNGYAGETAFAIETTAGSGQTLCSSFEEIARVVLEVRHPRLASCLDSAHVFAAGYGLNTPEEVRKTLDEFDRTIGLNLLIAVHLNDSLAERGSRKDRHAHLGQGKIRAEGLAALLTEPRLRETDFLLETPNDSGREGDIALCRRWLSEKR